MSKRFDFVFFVKKRTPALRIPALLHPPCGLTLSSQSALRGMNVLCRAGALNYVIRLDVRHPSALRKSGCRCPLQSRCTHPPGLCPGGRSPPLCGRSHPPGQSPGGATRTFFLSPPCGKRRRSGCPLLCDEIDFQTQLNQSECGYKKWNILGLGYFHYG